jgi:hypothetical protein
LLTDTEVNDINYIIKNRAYRYIAAAKEEWLYPENKISSKYWDKLGEGFLLMPDPRSCIFSCETIISGKNRNVWSYDAYGYNPIQREYNNQECREDERNSFYAFQGEFARRVGAKRRGVSLNEIERGLAEDSLEDHKVILQYEAKYKNNKKQK